MNSWHNKIGLGLILIGLLLVPTGLVLARPSAQESGYWEYVETVTQESTSPFNETRIASYSENSVLLHFENPPASQDRTIYLATCSWSWQYENGGQRLYPGETVKISLTVSNDSGNQTAYAHANMDMAYTTPSGDAGRGIVPIIYAGEGQSATEYGEYVVEAGPIPGWGDTFALEVTCGYGFSANVQRVYRWVPASTATVPASNPSASCLATITLDQDIQPGDEIYASAEVISSADGRTLYPQDGYWRYNGVQADSMQWDGQAATLEYVFTCPETGLMQTASLDIPPYRAPSDGADWVLVVGGLAAVGAMAVAVAAAAGVGGYLIYKNSRGKAKPSRQTYILQLSTQKVDIAEGQVHRLQINAWRVMPTGGYQPAPEAMINLYISDPNCGLQISPISGRGSLACTIALPKLRSSQTVTLTAVATASGAQTRGVVQINILAPVVLGAWVGGKKQTDVTYQAHLEAPRWDFGELIAYFHAPDHDSQPVTPPFQHTLGSPTFTSSPDILQVSNWGEHAAGQFSGDVALRPGVDLEQYLGPDLNKQGGVIPLTITVTAQDDCRYQQTVQFVICPTFELYVCDYDGSDLAKWGQGGHSYSKQGITWQEFEFAADGLDRLKLLAFATRTDKPPVRGQVPSAVANLLEIKAVEWKNADDQSEFLPPAVQLNPQAPGFFWIETGATSLLQATRARLTRPHVMEVNVGLREGLPARYRLARSSVLVTLQPQFLHLRLWIAPGLYRGTSDAFAYAKLFPCRHPYINQPLRLQVQTSGAAQLTLKHDADQATCAQESQPTDTITLVKGTARWTLQYSGMDWENLPQAIFEVQCQALDAHNALAFFVTETINVNQNVLDTLSALLDDNELAKELNNPAFLSDTVTPLFLRGPIWNIRQLFDCSAPFVCYRMRDKIIQWLEDRRLYNKKGAPMTEMARMRTMNGIEFDYYSMNPVHVWAGIFLSGMDRYGDYRAIDPWWEQSWRNGAYRKPEGLLTAWGEKAQVAKCAGTGAVVLGALYSVYTMLPIAAGVAQIYAVDSVMFVKAVVDWIAGHKIKTILAGLAMSKIDDLGDAMFTSASNYAGADGRLQKTDHGWLRFFIKQVDKRDAEIPAEV